MIHPLFKLIATRPELLAHHLMGYGQLVSVQAAEAAAQLRIRALLLGGVLVAGSLGLIFAGMALLLVAALPLHQMPMSWMLAAVPLVPLAVAAACAYALQRRPEAWSLKVLKEQLAADAALLQEASEAS